MDKELWEKILRFDLDDPLSEYGFSTRLANENLWTKNFTAKATIEYKKFMYLAATSDYMVSPSEIIDAVWHQHLIFTQSYNTLCNLIGKNIQHVPSTHSKEDAAKFKLARERTKKLYAEAFGAQPTEIWDYDDMLQSLGLPKMKYKIRTFIIVGIMAFLALLTPFYYLLRPIYIQIDNPDFLTRYLFIFVCFLIVLEMYNRYYLQRIVYRWPRNSFIYDLTAFELVYLKTGSLANVIHGLVNQLINENKLVINYDKTLQRIYYGIVTDAESYAVIESVESLRRAEYPVLVWRMQHTPVFANIANCMNAFRKYFAKSKAFGKLFYLNMIVLLAMLMFGFVRLLTGIMRDKPVVFIAIALIVAVIIVTAFLWRVVNLVCSNTIPQLYKASVLPTIENAGDWDWQYFLAGTAFLSTSFIPLVNRVENTSSSADGGSSCGGGCGGGGGGCGGGGCGGCGGG